MGYLCSDLDENHRREEGQNLVTFVLIMHIKTSLDGGIFKSLLRRMISQLIDCCLMIMKNAFLETYLRV